MRKNERLNIAQKIFIPIDEYTVIYCEAPPHPTTHLDGLCYRDDIFYAMIGGVNLQERIDGAVNRAMRNMKVGDRTESP